MPLDFCLFRNRLRTIIAKRPEVPEHQAYDHEQHGSASLFVTLNRATSEIIGKDDHRFR